MWLLNNLIVIVLTILNVVYLPAYVHHTLEINSETDNKITKSFIRFLFSKKPLFFIFLLGFIPSAIHATIDSIIDLFSGIFSFRYELLTESNKWSSFLGIYFLISFTIVTVTASICFRQFKIKSS